MRSRARIGSRWLNLLVGVLVVGGVNVSTEAGRLYWTNNSCSEICFSEIRSVNGDGSDPRELTGTFVSATWGIALNPNADQVYWYQSVPKGIRRGPETGCGYVVEDFYAGTLEIDHTAGYLYWVGPFALNRTKLDGSNLDVIQTPDPGRTFHTFALDAESSTLFIVDENSSDPIVDRLYSYDLSSEETSVLIASRKIYAVAIDSIAKKIYWWEEPVVGAGQVNRADYDGSNVETIVSISHEPALAVDPIEGKLYFTTGSESDIFRVNLDGTGQELVAEAYGVRQIAIDPYDEMDLPRMLCTDSDVPASDAKGAFLLGVAVLAVSSGWLYRRRRSGATPTS